MIKEEIISKIDILTVKVKRPGRAYSKTQREEMKVEISNLNIELGKIRFEEDVIFVSDFKKKHPNDLNFEIEALKSNLDKIINAKTDSKIKFLLEFKIKSFFIEINSYSRSQETIVELREALAFLEKNEKIPPSNPNSYSRKDIIQKSLANSLRTIESSYNKLKNELNEIETIIEFFTTNNKISAFVYLTDAIFSDASTFEKGYATVEEGSNKIYYSFNGVAYKINTIENEIPKIEIPRSNPDLIPFELEEGNFNRLYGYMNSKNEIIIPAKFKHASPFINGFAKVGILKKDWEKYHNTQVTYGLIDSTGKLVLPCDYIELGDVYNDIVLYKQHIYKNHMAQSWNFDWLEETKHIGLLSGYLIFSDIKSAIQIEIDLINQVKKTLSTLKTKGEAEHVNDKIRNQRTRIDFYLKYIIDSNIL